MRAAAKNRPVADGDLAAVAAQIEEEVRLHGLQITSAELGGMVLQQLRRLDEVAYVRFASVYKVFDDPGDFQREVLLLAQGDPPASGGPIDS